jgi:hypothetical protein
MGQDLGKKSRWVGTAMSPGHEILDMVPRALSDLPAEISPGARYVAQLTAWRTAQSVALKPIMEALKSLSELEQWGGPCLVADRVNFDWRTAPIKRYSSFEHFYQEELEETWGSWERLQAIYRKLVKGEISDAEVPREIEISRSHSENARRLAGDDGVPAAALNGGRREGAGRPAKGSSHSENARRLAGDDGVPAAGNQRDIIPLNSSRGTSAAHRVSKLKRDAPEFAARLAAGEFRSVRAAERAAGMRVSHTVGLGRPETVARRLIEHSPDYARAVVQAIEEQLRDQT